MKKLFSLFTFMFILQGLTWSQNTQQEWPDDFTQPPSQIWSYQTKGPIYSNPVVDNGIIYFGSVDSSLYAVNLSDGRLSWTFKTGGDIRSSVLIDANNVLLVSGDGCLYSINKTTHQLNWKFKSRGDKKYELFTFADYYQSSPIINKDTVFYGSGDQYVYAVNKSTGKLIWEYQTGGIVHATPLLHRNRIYVGSFDGYFYALESTSGKLAWKFKSIGQRYFPKGEMTGSAIGYGSMIFVGGRDYNLYSLHFDKGSGIWNKQFPGGWAIAKPVIKDTVLYVGTSDDKALFALDPFEGRVKWRTDVKFNVFGSYAFSKKMMYVPTLMGAIYAINLKDGSVAWRMNSDLYKKSHLDYFTEDDQYRDDIENIVTGEDGFLKMYYNLGAIFSTPLITGNYLVVTSTDGKIYAYKR